MYKQAQFKKMTQHKLWSLIQTPKEQNPSSHRKQGEIWLVTMCQWNSANTVDELCKQQFRWCGGRISATPHALLMVKD